MDYAKTVLIVEDDHDIAELVRLQVEELGLQSRHCSDGQGGYDEAVDKPYALLVLDLQLPSMGGIDVCRKLRAQSKEIPILMLTSRSEDIDKVLGLEMGADDYLTKPFNVHELRARLKALLRRSQMLPKASAEAAVLTYKELELDADSREVRLAGQLLELTPLEFDLLYTLMSRPGKVFQRNELLSQVWENDFENYEYSVTTHVSRLRKKLDVVPGYGKCIKTSRGAGYRFLREDEEVR